MIHKVMAFSSWQQSRDSGTIPICEKFKRERGGIFIVQNLTLLLVLAASAWYDVQEHRIPNWWVAVSMVCGMTLCILVGGSPLWTAEALREAGLFLGRMSVVAVLFFPLFFCRMIGAGDIKLAALICGYLSLAEGAVAVGLGFLIGAVWSFLKMAVRGSFAERFCYLTAYFRRVYQTKKITAYYDITRDGGDAVIPLGVCLFLGTAVFAMMRS